MIQVGRMPPGYGRISLQFDQAAATQLGQGTKGGQGRDGRQLSIWFLGCQHAREEEWTKRDGTELCGS